MHATASLDYRIHQMQLESPRSPLSPLNCQVLSLHLPHPSLQTSRVSSHLPSPMINPSRSQGSSFHLKPLNGSSYLTSSSSLSSHSDDRGSNLYHSRPVSHRSYDGSDEASRRSKATMRTTNGAMSQQEESETDMSSASAHLGIVSPAVARRAKAHVPSACVNCKRKHLACETRRPCNRCIQAGKEVCEQKIRLYGSLADLGRKHVWMSSTRNEEGRDSGMRIPGVASLTLEKVLIRSSTRRSLTYSICRARINALSLEPCLIGRSDHIRMLHMAILVEHLYRALITSTRRLSNLCHLYPLVKIYPKLILWCCYP
jgi:hypothetical protein